MRLCRLLLLQARHLWAFSSLLMGQPESYGFKASDIRAAADTVYSFMRNNMLRDVEGGEDQGVVVTNIEQLSVSAVAAAFDRLHAAAANGSQDARFGTLLLMLAKSHASLLLLCCAAGKLFVYEATREGKVANASINICGNAFAIYGLSAYAQATGSAEARILALNTFKTMDKLYHSPSTGGYDESTAGHALDSIRLAPATSGSSNIVTEAGPAAAYRAGKGRLQLSQSFNTLLHVAEALTELSKAVGGSDPTVLARLLEVTQLQTGPLIIRPNRAGPNTPNAYIG